MHKNAPNKCTKTHRTNAQKRTEQMHKNAPSKCTKTHRTSSIIFFTSFILLLSFISFLSFLSFLSLSFAFFFWWKTIMSPPRFSGILVCCNEVMYQCPFFITKKLSITKKLETTISVGITTAISAQPS